MMTAYSNTPRQVDMLTVVSYVTVQPSSCPPTFSLADLLAGIDVPQCSSLSFRSPSNTRGRCVRVKGQRKSDEEDGRWLREATGREDLMNCSPNCHERVWPGRPTAVPLEPTVVKRHYILSLDCQSTLLLEPTSRVE
jgi:hypothetical protein